MDSQFYQLMCDYPKLEISFENGNPFKIKGEIDITIKGACHGTFDCTIILCENYPYSFPSVSENSTKIPKSPDRHINSDNTFCLCVEPVAIIAGEKGVDINSFFEEFLIPFLAAQIYYDRFSKWAGGDYSHGKAGIIEFFEQKLNVTGKERVRQILTIYLSNRRNISKAKCLCKSNKTFINCCGVNYLFLESLPTKYLMERMFIFE